MKECLYYFIRFTNLIVEQNTIQIIRLEQILFSIILKMEKGKI